MEALINFVWDVNCHAVSLTTKKTTLQTQTSFLQVLLEAYLFFFTISPQTDQLQKNGEKGDFEVVTSN